MTSPRGLRPLRWNAGSGARHRRRRLLPGRRAPARPRAPRSLCSPPGLGGRAAPGLRAGKRDAAQLTAGSSRRLLRGRSVGGQWENHGGGAREEASWGSVPKVAVPPERLVIGRKGSNL